ncbi:MAG: 4Fe-4S cluster-binding domain-containing protein, partial [Peptococcaceae bacterium]|nr:4Fe-4S cluster-binding domain-containing protein [Peptococcaceae bacterium]
HLPYIAKVDVLVDGPFQIDKLDVKLHWRGSSNQRVINVKETLRLGQMVLWSE